MDIYRIHDIFLNIKVGRLFENIYKNITEKDKSQIYIGKFQSMKGSAHVQEKLIFCFKFSICLLVSSPQRLNIHRFGLTA